MRDHAGVTSTADDKSVNDVMQDGLVQSRELTVCCRLPSRNTPYGVVWLVKTVRLCADSTGPIGCGHGTKLIEYKSNGYPLL